VYANDPLAKILRDLGAHVLPVSEALTVVHNAMQSPQAIWGFSGYATEGRPYRVLGNALRSLFGFLTTSGNRPPLVCHGGSNEGVLGLADVLARHHGIPTLGFTPLQGLDSMGASTHGVIGGDTYRSRERLVATPSDLLACAGGHDGTRRELDEALKGGGVGLLLAFEDYRPESLLGSCHTTGSTATFAEFLKYGERLVVCRSFTELPAKVSQALAVAAQSSMLPPNRTARFNRLVRYLAEQT
jgi:hypothetical protein